MQDWLYARAQATPGNTAVIIGDEKWTYGQLQGDVTHTAARLATYGISAGDRVGVVMANIYDYVVLIHALMRLGAILVPINIRLTIPEMRWQVQNAHCKLLIHGGEDVSELADTVEDVLGYDDLPAADVVGGAYSQRPFALDEPLVIVHTSGTTGRPKGAVLTYGNIFYSAMSSAYRIGTLPNDRWLCVIPLYHVGGLSIVLRSCLYGTAVDLVRRFDADALSYRLIHEPITLMSLVPTMLQRLLDAKRNNNWTTALRLVLLGGAAATPDLLKRCIAQSVPVATTYGLSEAASQVATALPSDAHVKPGSVGKPVMFTSLRIADETGHSVPINTFGEIVVGGPTVMLGYDGDEQGTQAKLRDGELYTGDIGYIDDDGDLWVVQRRQDLIVSGGENVYPAEVEKALCDHPDVEAAAVVGVPDPTWGHRVAAALVLRPQSTVGEADIEAYVRERLAGFKLPRRIIFVDELPVTGSGKVQRGALIDLFRDEDQH